MVKVTSLLFGRPKPWAEYAFVALRLAIAGLWLNAVIPRWNTVAAGKALSNNLVRTLFGASMVPSLTLFFTLLETLGAIALILGVVTRLAAMWGVIEFGVISISGLIGGTIRVDVTLLAGSIALLLYGSFLLSVDGLIAKKA